MSSQGGFCVFDLDDIHESARMLAADNLYDALPSNDDMKTCIENKA